MNNIYRVIRSDNGLESVIGHFNSRIIASVVLFQLNHRKESKLKYVKSHKYSSEYEYQLEHREYRMDSVAYDDSYYIDIIKKEPSIGQLKKEIYSR